MHLKVATCMNVEVKDTWESVRYVYHTTLSRTAGTWHVFPLTPWCPLRKRAGGDDYVDGNAVEVKGSKQFLGKVSRMYVGVEHGLERALPWCQDRHRDL
jgi:hypothetical protein